MSIWMWLSGISAVQLRALTDKNKELRKDLELAADRLDFAANWIENSWGGTNIDVELVRRYAIDARSSAKE